MNTTDVLPLVASAILSAKIGRERKEAQIETCTVFAAALYDVLSEQGLPCRLMTASCKGISPWAHSVVELDGHYFDSMGEFSLDIYRQRAKIHPSVALVVEYTPDTREDCFDEEDFTGLHEFLVGALRKAAGPLIDYTSSQPRLSPVSRCRKSRRA